MVYFYVINGNFNISAKFRNMYSISYFADILDREISS
jgi:hypothetical protein